jgi:hypothetical protein
MKKDYKAPDAAVIELKGREVLTSSCEWVPEENETERSSTSGRFPGF